MSNSTYIVDEKLLAKGGIRFVNYIVDIIFILITIFVLALILAIFANIFAWFEVLSWMGSMTDLDGQLVFWGTMILYYLFFEGLFGRSIAKFITGTTVVNENGEKPVFGVILKRTFCRLIPFDALSFLGSRGWHDSISDTYVVHKKALAAEVKMHTEFGLIGNSEVN
jgi:uncharacterized RDD family membrane protein YckC